MDELSIADSNHIFTFCSMRGLSASISDDFCSAGEGLDGDEADGATPSTTIISFFSWSLEQQLLTTSTFAGFADSCSLESTMLTSAFASDRALEVFTAVSEFDGRGALPRLRLDGHASGGLPFTEFPADFTSGTDMGELTSDRSTTSACGEAERDESGEGVEDDDD